MLITCFCHKFELNCEEMFLFIKSSVVCWVLKLINDAEYSFNNHYCTLFVLKHILLYRFSNGMTCKNKIFSTKITVSIWEPLLSLHSHVIILLSPWLWQSGTSWCPWVMTLLKGPRGQLLYVVLCFIWHTWILCFQNTYWINA